MAFSSFSERDALLENDSEHHDERSIPVGMEASTSSTHASSSSFASRITTKSFALGVAGMVLFAYAGHTVKQRMLGAEHGGDAVRFYHSKASVPFIGSFFSLLPRGVMVQMPPRFFFLFFLFFLWEKESSISKEDTSNDDLFFSTSSSYRAFDAFSF